MSIQHIWNLFQLLGLFTCRKLATLSWNFVTETCKQLPGLDYVAENWALPTYAGGCIFVQPKAFLLPITGHTKEHIWRLIHFTGRDGSPDVDACGDLNARFDPTIIIIWVFVSRVLLYPRFVPDVVILALGFGPPNWKWSGHSVQIIWLIWF